ncbi:MAG: hypothetical protein K1566_18720 [Candidatus Thiodiazotropha sp. (ex. Lucinisca nassula)]|nr:hypothetical protein [Candidatus Thiodiazotropha sp. (ex. Lucinisca nassula)]
MADLNRRDTYQVVVFFQALESITVLFMVMKIMNFSMQQGCRLRQQKQQDQHSIYGTL